MLACELRHIDTTITFDLVRYCCINLVVIASLWISSCSSLDCPKFSQVTLKMEFFQDFLIFPMHFATQRMEILLRIGGFGPEVNLQREQRFCNAAKMFPFISVNWKP